MYVPDWMSECRGSPKPFTDNDSEDEMMFLDLTVQSAEIIQCLLHYIMSKLAN